MEVAGQRPSHRRNGQAGVAFLGYASLTLLFFWPLLGHLADGLHDRSDTTLNTWIIAWQAHILPIAAPTLFDAPIFWPLPNSLALSEILWPIAPLAVPWLAATGNPVLVYNLFFLAAFPLAGMGAYLLTLHVTGCRLSAFLAGLIYAFSPHQFGHLSQLQLLSIAWLPLTLLYLDRFWAAGRPRDGFLFALAAAFQTLSAFYYGFQVALTVGLYVIVRLLVGLWSWTRGHLVARPRARRPAARGLPLLALIPWVVLAGILIAPFAIPYLRMRSDLGLERSLDEALRSAATLAEWVQPPAANPLYRLIPGLASVEGGLFPGFIVLALAALGLLAGRLRAMSAAGRPQIGRGYWLLLALSAVTLSLGPQLKLTAADSGRLPLPFGWLYEHLPGMTAIRAPGRFANSAFLALALLAGTGTARLIQALSAARNGEPIRQKRRVAWAFLLAPLILAEYAGGMETFAVRPMPPTASPLATWLADHPAGAIVELPLSSDMAAPPAGPTNDTAEAAWPDYNLLRYQYFQTGHWQPTVDGYSGFVPPHHRELGLTLAHFPDARSRALLSGLGVGRVIIHSQVMEAFQPGRAAALRQVLAALPDVVLEQEFGPTWVYRLLSDQAAAGTVVGRFWSTADGQAFLILATATEREVVLAPGRPLRVRGVWQPIEGGAPRSFELALPLPLLVGEGSVLPLALPRPETAGRYWLRLATDDPRVRATSFVQEVAVATRPEPAQLLAIQAAAPVVAGSLAAGHSFTITLSWRLLDRPDADASISARLLDAAGQRVSQDDRALSGGRDLIRGWQSGMVVTTTHTLPVPAGAAPSALQVFLYRPDDSTRLYFLDESGSPTTELRVPLR